MMRVNSINPFGVSNSSRKIKNNKNETPAYNAFQRFQSLKQKRDEVSFKNNLKEENSFKTSSAKSQILNPQDEALVEKYNDSRACAMLSKEEIIKAQRLKNYYENVKEIYDKLNVSSSKVALNRADIAKAIYLATKDCASKDETIESLTSNINGLINLLDNQSNNGDYSCGLETYFSADQDKNLSLLVAQVRDNAADKNYIEMIQLNTCKDEANFKNNLSVNNGFKSLKRAMA